MQALYAKDAIMWILSVFNYFENVNVFVRMQKRTKADKNVYCVYFSHNVISDHSLFSKKVALVRPEVTTYLLSEISHSK